MLIEFTLLFSQNFSPPFSSLYLCVTFSNVVVDENEGGSTVWAPLCEDTLLPIHRTPRVLFRDLVLDPTLLLSASIFSPHPRNHSNPLFHFFY